MTERKTVFVREATGLVKEVDLKSVTVYNYVSNGIPMVASAIVLALVPFMFPEADYVLGWVITAIGLSFNAVIYAMLTSSMPRSGGEYVFLSRIISLLYHNIWHTLRLRKQSVLACREEETL